MLEKVSDVYKTLFVDAANYDEDTVIFCYNAIRSIYNKHNQLVQEKDFWIEQFLKSLEKLASSDVIEMLKFRVNENYTLTKIADIYDITHEWVRVKLKRLYSDLFFERYNYCMSYKQEKIQNKSLLLLPISTKLKRTLVGQNATTIEELISCFTEHKVCRSEIKFKDIRLIIKEYISFYNIEIKPEDNILFLRLSERAYNALARNDICTIEKLANLNSRKLSALLGVGPAMVDEIVTNKTYLKYHKIKNEKTFFSLEDNINVLDLSIRASNALKRFGITTIGELCSVSDYDLLGIPGIGQITCAEILENKLFKMYNVLYKENTEFNDISIHELKLSFRAFAVLKRSGINTVGDLMRAGDLIKVKRLGVSTLAEINEKLTIFLSK